MGPEKEILISAKVVIPVVITFLAPFFIYIFHKSPNHREGISFIAAITTFLSVLSMAPDVMAGKIVKYTVFTIMPGITVSFAADGLAMVFGLVSSFLWFITTSYNVGYMRGLQEHAQTRYYVCFSVAILGAQGVSFSSNLFTMYLFYEIITVFTYPLVAHHQDEEGYSGGRKYLVYLVGSAKLFLLPAMVITYVVCGTLDFHLGDAMRGMYPSDASAVLVTIAYALFIAGLAKAAIMPLHNWLPSAMVAPTPVSALLHAVAVVKAGVFCICRVILSGFGLDTMDRLGLGIPTAYIAAFTIVAASIIAMTKDDLKARLAYSTVSQLSYIVMGVAMLTPVAVEGGVLHIANHAVSKITLFFTAGAIYVATRTKAISQMKGFGWRMPWTFGAFGLASLSMIGIPPVCGFVSKWYLVNGALDIGQIPLLVALLVSTILNAGYFAPVLFNAFFRSPDPGVNIESYSEAPLTMVVPLFFTAVVSVLLGLYPQSFLQFINMMAGW